MKEIEINNHTKVQVDDGEYLKVVFYDWKLHRKKTNKQYIYAYTNITNQNNKREKLFLHHLIFGRAPIGKVFWFKDGNTLNCQKSNVEIISYSEKAHLVHNIKKEDEDSFRGVVANYLARIKVGGRIKVIGVFKSKEEAANAYNEAAIKLYGDLAVLNNI